MIKKIKILIVTVFLTAFGGITYANFQDGLNAYDKGDYKTAFKEWQYLAESGDYVAQINLANLYVIGKGVERDISKAINWYEKAAKFERKTWNISTSERTYFAHKRLGFLYSNHFVQKYPDLNKALDWYGYAANRGDAAALYSLAYLYRTKKEVKDLDFAFELDYLAATSGHKNAQNSLANLYEEGVGIEKDLSQSTIWRLKAAKQGQYESQFKIAGQYVLGRGVDKDRERAFYWLTKAANNPDIILPSTRAEYNFLLGQFYFEGFGVEANQNKALELYLNSAKDGDAKAQYSLGVMYANGTGVLKNDKEAEKWHQKAANQGNALAEFNLGVMYDNGTGVLEDDKQAVKWYQKAADQGYADAQYNLGVMYANGRGVLKDDKQAIKWYRKAADQGNALAQFNLALMYAKGEGVIKDDKQAIKWYRKAADQGDASAQSNLGVMYAFGTGVLKDMTKAKYWIKKAYENPDASASTLGGAEKAWSQLELWKY